MLTYLLIYQFAFFPTSILRFFLKKKLDFLIFEICIIQLHLLSLIIPFVKSEFLLIVNNNRSKRSTASVISKIHQNLPFLLKNR